MGVFECWVLLDFPVTLGTGFKFLQTDMSATSFLREKSWERQISRHTLRNLFYWYNRTSLIRTPKGQNKVSVLERCPLYRGHEY